MAAEQSEFQALRDKAYASFTDHLLARTIAPGQFVSQRELVEITGMPLGAIREMIPRLEADGLIRTVPQRGLQVAQVDLSLIRNAFQLRMMIEREAVTRYCQIASQGEVEALLADHRAAAAEATGWVTPTALDRAQELDWAFHDRMVDALENELIANIYRVNSVRIRLIRLAQTRMLPALLPAVMAEHIAILEAILARDTPAAVAALEAHIDIARRRALGV
ncbi:MAG: GntR family transcriptional regulator [Rhodobacteraceae bacterium]|nr:GntR family transcriptional regulator [Paracoccaceae bacterium]